MQTQRGSFLDKLSPQTQKYVRRAVGLGLSCYLGRTMITSQEFKDLMSMVCRWKTRKAEQLVESDGSGGDTGDILQRQGKIPPILGLIPELRQKCWEYVSPRDLKTLRLCCKRFQCDIDYVVGLSVGIDSRHEESFDWIKHIAIQACTIYHLPNYSDWTLFLKPKTLKCLKFTELITISPRILNIILSTFTSLEKLEVYFEHDLFLDDMDYISLFDTFKALESKLSKLSVKYIDEFRIFQWILDITMSEFPCVKLTFYPEDAILLPSHLSCINVDLEHYNAALSSSYKKLRFFFRKIMDFQKHLKQLKCNLGPVSWDVYAQAIRDSRNTLEEIHLDNISCWDSWNAKDERETSFDWNLIQNCPKLKNLCLSGENCNRLGPLTYIPLRGSSLHLHTINCSLGVVFWKIYSSIVVRSSETLKNVKLLKLTTFSSNTGDDIPFDFSIFAKCENLSSLVIGGQQLTYMDIQALRSLPRGIENLQLFWVYLTKQDILFIRSQLNHLQSNSKFLEFCTITGLEENEKVKDLWNGTHTPKSASYWQAFAYAWNSFPLPILDTLGLLWLMWVD